MAKFARADALYCSARCRVRVYRQRQSLPSPSQSSETAAAAETSQDAPRTTAEPSRDPRTQPSKVTVAEVMRQFDERMARIDHSILGVYQILEESKQQLAQIAAKYTASLAQAAAEERAKLSNLPPQPPPISPVAILPPKRPETRLNYEDSHRGVSEKPEDSLEAARRGHLHKLIQQGYSPAEDALAFAKLEEIEAFDRLSRWQAEQSVPLTVEPIPPEKDREFLAAIGALRERRHYYSNRPLERFMQVRWIHEEWELDPESEADLLRRVYTRIKEKLRIPQHKIR